jgi:hypothetical protein
VPGGKDAKVLAFQLGLDSCGGQRPSPQRLIGEFGQRQAHQPTSPAGLRLEALDQGIEGFMVRSEAVVLHQPLRRTGAFIVASSRAGAQLVCPPGMRPRKNSCYSVE